jgi:uncharacterized cupredoxin-like copper-binding protein
MSAFIARIGSVAFLALTLSGASYAATSSVVNIALEDASTGGGMAGMRIAVDQESVKAGRIIFQVVNQSRTLVHEMIVVSISAKRPVLPYSEKKARVIESRIRRLGEISDLKPGASGKLTLDLKPGHYMLICNEPGHFMAGMKVPFEVSK